MVNAKVSVEARCLVTAVECVPVHVCILNICLNTI